MAAPRAKNCSRVRVSLTTYEAAIATLAELWKKICTLLNLVLATSGGKEKKMSKIKTKEAPFGEDKDGGGGIERCSLVSNTVSKVSSEDNRDAALLAKCLHL